MRHLEKLHPLLFATYSSLALLANNLGQLGISAAVRGTAVSVALTGLILLVVWILVRDLHKAALLTSGAVLLVGSYGHVQRLAGSLLPAAFANYALPALWLVSLLGWGYLTLRRLSDPRPLARAFLLIGLVLNAIPTLTLIQFSRNTGQTSEWILEYRRSAWRAEGLVPLEDGGGPIMERGDPPDIYYIVLDAYTREDVLAEIYDYDNRPFLQALEERGFYVAAESRSNYPTTLPSIASSLNMIHVDDLPAALAEHGTTPNRSTIDAASSRLVGKNRVVEALRAEGYRVVSFDGGYTGSYLEAPDEFRQPPSLVDHNFWQIGFEVMLLDTTVGRELRKRLDGVYSPMERMFDAHRERVLYALEHLPDYAGSEEPHFVYAHIVSPHVPYVFGPNGERITADDPYTLLNARPGAEDNIGKYRDQVHFLNGLILETVDEILAASEVPPIIILQGDHSSKVYSDPDPPPEVEDLLLLPILNAYHLPGSAEHDLYPHITPVNTFRIVLNDYYGRDLPLAADASFLFAEQEGATHFVSACTRTASCPESP